MAGLVARLRLGSGQIISFELFSLSIFENVCGRIRNNLTRSRIAPTHFEERPMETIAVHCSWADAQLLADPFLKNELPQELLNIIRLQSGRNYLNGLSFALLIPQCTDSVFRLYEPLVIDLLARAFDMIGDVSDAVKLLCAVARLLPYLPSLRFLVHNILLSDDPRHLGFLSKPSNLSITSLRLTEIHSLLLTLFRLFSYDLDTFRGGVAPVLLSSLCNHEVLPIRYLANRCVAMYMQMTDAATQDLLLSCVSNGPIRGHWENQEIDYRLLSLFEEERWSNLTTDILRTRQLRNPTARQTAKNLTSAELSSRVCTIGEVLLLRQAELPHLPPSLVPTQTTIQNLTKLGQALLKEGPVVLIGVAGSGKTSLICEAALALGKLPSIVTLYLNEQTDVKSLLGLYTTTLRGGSFEWKPGILTQAVSEGRWVVIEHLDRASPEFLSVLIPIIEHGELLIPNRRERIRAAQGFKLLGTIRTKPSIRHETTSVAPSILGARLWHKIPISPLSIQDVEDIISKKFPLLQLHCPLVVRILLRLRALSGEGKVYSDRLRELLRWCQRMQTRLESSGLRARQDTISESLFDDFLLDGTDCLAGAIPPGNSKNDIIKTIAEELQCSPQRLNFLLKDRQPELVDLSRKMVIGKESLQKHLRHQKANSQSQPFAKTRHFRSLLESVAACVRYKEPLLLVGETGIGKTTVIQYLAAILGQELVVINLSQQSESADLIGGFKPVSVRSMMVPLMEEFDILFDVTFSAKRNESFLVSIQKSVVKQNWQRLLLLWDEAIRMAEDNIRQKLALQEQSSRIQAEKPIKRRKVDVAKFDNLRIRWVEFALKVKTLRGRMSGGEERFAFSFVEGKLTTALRRGTWVLLDEINLASSETLETISSILNHGTDGSPSIMLSDAGQIDPIIGSDNFRVFASMNPSTDIGKKELPPALRSRFTELYVDSPDKELHDLTVLIQAYISPLLMSDQRATTDLALLYLDAKSLAEKNQLSDGAGHKPHYSIRNLVRCLLYVAQHASTYGLRRAIHEGFSMSFMTILNGQSEQQLSSKLERRILGNHGNAQSSLNQTPRPPADKHKFVLFKHYWVSKGEESPINQPKYIITPFVERNLLNLARATSMKRFPILLQGPTSSGKTSMIEYLANISGNKFVRINNHEHTDLQEYLGTYSSANDGKFQYKDGVLVDALRYGKWIVLDELNLAPTDVLEALNRLLDDNRELLVPETQELVRPHPHFMLFATQNPAGLYGGRKYLSRAFRNRFLELHFDDIPENELEIILRERSQIPQSYGAKIVAVYKRLSLLRQSSRVFEQQNSFMTLRDLFRWALRFDGNKDELAKTGFMLLGERVRDPLERNAVKEIIQDVFKIRIMEDELYGDGALQDENARTEAVLTWTPATRRLFILISKALHNNEPVLLVGDTGCGKTQICQEIAQAHGRLLDTVNAHANTEAGDLIGAQRPLRNRALIEKTLCNDLKMILALYGGQQHSLNVDLQSLLALFKDLSPAFLQTVDSDLLLRVRANMARINSLFEWVDGNLTKAMKEGHYFLFDEISLADDSVLERLNSVLEPRRSLFLAEKGSSESDITASQGFQFMATMNPGGDHGKRELSAALRNRLTEIWVPPLAEDMDVIPILKQKLPAFPGLPEIMIAFGRWFHEHFYATARSAMSLRELLSWADFIQSHSLLGVSHAVAHGALMIYIDALGANPAGAVIILPSQIHECRAKCLQRLGQLLRSDLTSALDHPHFTLQPRMVHIGPFSAPRTLNASLTPSFFYEAPTTLQNAMRIFRALQLPRPILLEGNPGVGKTAIVTSIADLVGKPLTRINLSEQTDLMDLFGSDVPMEGANAGKFVWRDGPFLKAMQNGDWVLLDEMNLASQSILEGLNSCIDHRQEVYVAELGQSFRRHPEFVLFAAQNFHHHGGGRKGLPLSFTNRFTVVYADILKSDDLQIVAKKAFPNAPPECVSQIVTFVATYNAKLAGDSSVKQLGDFPDLNLRDILRWLNLCQHNNFRLSPRRFLDLILAQRLRVKGQKQAILRLWHNTFHDKEHNNSYFHNLTPSYLQVGLGIMQRISGTAEIRQIGGRFSTRLLPTLESLILCIEHRWPAILVGESGCGKSLLLRTLASLRGARLLELSLSKETDASDLIGGYEQLDYSRQATEALNEAKAILRNRFTFMDPKTLDADSQQWLQLYQLIVNTKDVKQAANGLFVASQHYPEILIYAQKLEKVINQASSPDKVSFQWLDGMLVEALESGSWVVLDNANLCDASVLDRLNSLLEFNGNIVVNEQHTPEGVPRTITPHPDFRIFLTMNSRHGELSRAMRNRSVELYVDGGQTDPPLFQTPHYYCEAKTYRLRLLNDTKALQIPDARRQVVRDVGLDHMALADLEIANHLFSTNSNDRVRVHIYRQMATRMQRLDAALDRSTTVFENSKRLSIVTSAEEQPIGVLVNEPFVQLSTDPELFKEYRILHWVQCKVIELLTVRYHLHDSEEAVQRLDSSQMTVLQRSIASLRIGPRNRNTGSLIVELMSEILELVDKLLVSMESTFSAFSQEFKSIVDSGLNWADTMLYVTCQTAIEEVPFRGYMEIGWNALNRLTRLSNTIFTSPRNPTLKSLDHDLSSSQGLQRIWPHWRPKTPSNLTDLDAHNKLEAVARSLDSFPLDSPTLSIQVARWRSTVRDLSCRILDGKSYDFKIIEDMSLATTSMKNSKRNIGRSILSTTLEMLCQYRDLGTISLGGRKSDMEDDQFLPLLAGRSIELLGEFSSASTISNLLSSMAGYAGWKAERSALAAVEHSLSLQALLEVSNVQQWPLTTLQSLDERMAAAAHSLSIQAARISADPLESIKSATKILLESIIECHSDVVMLSKAETEMGPFFVKRDGVSGGHYLLKIANNYFEPAFRFLNTRDPRLIKLLVGAALLDASLGALHLLLPDKAFDPAMNAILERELYASRLRNLNDRLEGIRVFEDLFSGQSTNIRCNLFLDDIAQMGQEPPEPSVFRPNTSELSSVHTVFQNIMHSVRDKHPEKIFLSNIALAENEPKPIHKRRKEFEILRENISSASSRLLDSSGNYRDLTVPVMRTLQCIDLGARLVALSEHERSECEVAIQYVSDSTPLLGAVPDLVFSLLRNHSHADSRPNSYAPFHKLNLHVTDHNLRQSSTYGSSNLSDLFQNFYEEWKRHLDKDKAIAAERSKFYHYRGEEVEETEDMQELFPNFTEVEARAPTEISTLQYDPKAAAIELATAQQRLFGSDTKSLESLLDASGKTVARLMAENEIENDSLAPDRYLSIVFLRLKWNADHLHSSNEIGSINFYTSSNFVEARKLVELVSSIRNRFIFINESWPEHATPRDVLQCCSELLAFKIIDPIAKIIVKVDRLYGIISEWQEVASSEFSVNLLLAEITRLIISWRKLEMMSWAELLDREDKRAQEEAMSWWFLLYENIVVLPQQGVLDDGAERLVTETATNLDLFLRNSPVGQYSARLDMLGQFSRLLQNSASEATQSAVSNVIKYHDRRTGQVLNFLSTGRERLTKDIQEQIKLASWRDTNVVALRESARKSHHKLLKVVRQYRALINHSVDSIMAPTNIPNLDLSRNNAHDDSLRTSSHTSNPAILAACVGAVDWESRPERLKDLPSAAVSMHQIYRRSSLTFDVTKAIRLFTADFTQSVQELRKDTPARLTDENSLHVKHLKSRKRRCLTDTLKILREMGVSSNVNSKELAQQDALAKTLARVSYIESSIEGLDDADSFYYGFLDILSLVRQGVRQPNDELAASEVARGAGFSEGLMYMLRRQRNNLAPAIHDVISLENVVGMIKRLEVGWSEKPFQSFRAVTKSREERLQCALAWVPSLLKLSCSIIENQQTFSNGRLDFSSVITGLASHAQILEIEKDNLHAESQTLLATVRSASDLDSISRAFGKFAVLKQDLQSWQSSVPQLCYVLKQLKTWADLDTYPEDTAEAHRDQAYSTGPSLATSEVIDRRVSNVANKMFVAMQLLSENARNGASSTEDTKWLMSSEDSIISSVKSLHMKQIVLDWRKVLFELGNVHLSHLQASIALCILILPALEQYLLICRNVLQKLATLHEATCKMSFTLGRTFSQILNEGFCSPLDGSTEAEGGKVETGIGLGGSEGAEAAEDISKDVGEDEDLSEIAHQGRMQGEQEEIEAIEEAVETGKDELEGAVDENGEVLDDNGETNPENDDGIDEEVGSVDNLDPAAVDEKLWDGLAKDDENELENQNAQGKTSDEQAADQLAEPSKVQDRRTTDNDHEGNDLQDEETTDGQDSISEDAINAGEYLDQMDPYTRQEERIDLSEEIQLDGEIGSNDDVDVDDALDELSDMEVAQEESDQQILEEESMSDAEGDITDEQHKFASEMSDIVEEEGTMSDLKDEALKQQNDGEPLMHWDDVVQGNSGGGGETLDKKEDSQATQPISAHDTLPVYQKDNPQNHTAQDGSQGAEPEAESRGAGRLKNAESRKQQEAFKKLGDIFERWHRQKRDIFQPSEDNNASSTDVDLVDVDFEHVMNEEDIGEAQALGAATQDQAHRGDESNGIEDNDTQPTEDQPMLDVERTQQTPTEVSIEDHASSQERPRATSIKDMDRGAFIPNRDQRQDSYGIATAEEEPEDLLDTDKPLQFSPHIDPPSSESHSAALWAHYSNLTHNSSLQLATQLRLLLAPTTATKLRGDYRTGKRLNMKRIIPFIASGYRRDKIWLRRSLPSKRNYQVILAVDDSRSMLEGSVLPPLAPNGASPATKAIASMPSGLAARALESLALVAKSFSMLEVGDLAIIAFGGSSTSSPHIGSPIYVAHPFGVPFTESGGPGVFSSFSFRQSGTDVAGLVRQSVGMLREARQQSQTASSGLETWQLEIIVGDAVFDGHDEIRRLVRAAAEEKIAFVYIIVDHNQQRATSYGNSTANTTDDGGQSILDLQRATFDAQGNLVMRNYLKTFPFPFYVVVREVQELGGVLCEVLRGWFGEVSAGNG